MLILKSVNFEQREFQTHQLEASQPGQTEWVDDTRPVIWCS
jgi:hypothetical protein